MYLSGFSVVRCFCKGYVGPWTVAIFCNDVVILYRNIKQANCPVWSEVGELFIVEILSEVFVLLAVVYCAAYQCTHVHVLKCFEKDTLEVVGGKQDGWLLVLFGFVQLFVGLGPS